MYVINPKTLSENRHKTQNNKKANPGFKLERFTSGFLRAK